MHTSEPIEHAGRATPAMSSRGVAAAPAGHGAGEAGGGVELPPPGARIGSYELIRELGRGGMGAVWLARDIKLGRRVAIKFLHSARPEITKRFIREARATAQCSHENIVVIHEVDEVAEYPGQPFMVLEYLDGAPLSKQIDGRRMPAPRAVELMVPVARALVCAHAHGIVHRDLKPDNILVTDTGVVKVLDFGIAKLLHDERDAAEGPRRSLAAELAEMPEPRPGDSIHTRRGALLGTMPYMSPEQWLGDGVDHRTDVWAAGIILYQMVAGQHPLHPLTGVQYAYACAYETPMPGVRGPCPDLPDDLANLIDHCLVKHKQQRLGSAQALLEALEALLPGRHARPLRADQSPYPGLRAFQKRDAHRFFGRTPEIAAAVARLREQPLLAVVGPSGVGKSSFVRAGVLPALERSGETWTALIVRPGRQPLDSLAQLVAPLAAGAGTVAGTAAGTEAGATGTVAGSAAGTAAPGIAGALSDHQEVRRRLLAEPGWLGALLRSRAHHKGQRILVFVDQFEELYTLGADLAERRAFTACLASAADDATTPLRVVVSVRSDFLDRVAEDPYFLTELTRGLFFLTPPGRDELREALVGPAELAGFAFESPATIEHMLDHLVHIPGALPLLQFAAARLWDMRDRARRLFTDESYAALGGIAGALASHADAVMAELPAHGESWQLLARALFLRLVTPERTRALVPVAELHELAGQGVDPASIPRLVDHLVGARLLVVQGGDGEGAARGATVEIVHESLIQTWPRLRRWLDENQDDAAFLEQLRTAARQWHARGYPVDLLWRGEVAEEARHWHRRYRGELPQMQRAYLAAVFALAARSARRTRWLVAGAMVFLTALAAAATVGLLLIRSAQKEAVQQAAEVERQLGRALTAEAEARVERERALTASSDLARVNQTLEQSNAELVAAVEAAQRAQREAEAARIRAESAEGDARRDRAHAVTKEQEARAAETRAREAGSRLRTLLDQERERVRRLERQGASHGTQELEVE
jgi:serine/threonine protein kinase